ncbi:hypothetical protein FHS16_005919 [Paenibacillus endophyticus]|uniref:Uncharacterized protein n=1 Tax=Paenibacillus endophyticus TaxID=1294268 RepID=A0A7W5CDP9_9BACL|nr:hypothetical protein [Paenibacillus endophyticus]
MDILDDREKEVVIGRFGLEHGGDLAELFVAN